jgi:hypothetical protein
VCAAVLPSGGPALVVHGCDCAEALACTARVAGTAIAITARSVGNPTCDECNLIEGVCELDPLPRDASIAVNVGGRTIGELETDSSGGFAAGPCFDAPTPGPD